MLKVRILDDYANVAMSLADWAGELPGTEVTALAERVDDLDVLASALAGAEVVVAMRERTEFSRELLERLPDLKLLVTSGMKNAAIDVGAAKELGVTVCGTAGLASPTAELTWGLILSLSRHIPTEDASIRSGGWNTTLGRDLEGRTLGILGLGRLGSRVAAVGVAFGMDVVAWSPSLTDQRALEVGARRVERDELFAAADVLTIHVKLSEATRGTVGESELRAMKHSALLINTSRGEVVQEEALIRALRDGWIGGAGLDVFDDEPLPHDHPLRTSPSTVLTPHLGYVTENNFRLFFEEALDDIRQFVDGTPVRVIDV